LKLIIDLDDPDPLPLWEWLRMLQRIRIQHEFARLGNKVAVAKQLGISR
jgi:hypothetical protein